MRCRITKNPIWILLHWQLLKLFVHALWLIFRWRLLELRHNWFQIFYILEEEVDHVITALGLFFYLFFFKKRPDVTINTRSRGDVASTVSTVWACGRAAELIITTLYRDFLQEPYITAAACLIQMHLNCHSVMSTVSDGGLRELEQSATALFLLILWHLHLYRAFILLHTNSIYWLHTTPLYCTLALYHTTLFFFIQIYSALLFALAGFHFRNYNHSTGGWGIELLKILFGFFAHSSLLYSALLYFVL